jgi:CO/xanthine dehydrogenase FAD-binding subunit
MPPRRRVVEGVDLQVPAPFDYERATSVEHAIALLEELGPGARLLAGGHSLLPMMKLRLAVPDHVIDIDRWRASWATCASTTATCASAR